MSSVSTSMKMHWGTTYSDIIILVSCITFGKIAYTDRKKQKWQFWTTPLSFDAAYPAIPMNIGTTVIYPYKLESLRYIYAAGSMGQSSFKF